MGIQNAYQTPNLDKINSHTVMTTHTSTHTHNREPLLQDNSFKTVCRGTCTHELLYMLVEHFRKKLHQRDRHHISSTSRTPRVLAMVGGSQQPQLQKRLWLPDRWPQRSWWHWWQGQRQSQHQREPCQSSTCHTYSRWERALLRVQLSGLPRTMWTSACVSGAWMLCRPFSQRT